MAGTVQVVGSAFLVATIVGSGMMGDNLSDDDGVALLVRTRAHGRFAAQLSALACAHVHTSTSATLWRRHAFWLARARARLCACDWHAVHVRHSPHLRVATNAPLTCTGTHGRRSPRTTQGNTIATLGMLYVILRALFENNVGVNSTLCASAAAAPGRCGGGQARVKLT